MSRDFARKVRSGTHVSQKQKKEVEKDEIGRKNRMHENKKIEERVILVGVSEQDGDDTEDSLAELAELVHTAGATAVGTLGSSVSIRIGA